jgi:hypothetical protein
MSGKIDDPLDASLEASERDPESSIEKLLALSARLSGVFFPRVALASILWDQFSSEKRNQRIEYLLKAVELKLKEQESRIDDGTIESLFENPTFRSAVATACEEASRAATEQKLDQLAAIVCGLVIPNEWADPKDDPVSMIRDVVQLGDVDIRVLRIMEEAFRKVYGYAPNLVTNQFVEHIDDLTKAMHASGIHQDDFYGTCLRLSGFGLATEERPTVRSNGERCFRPTRRGLSVLFTIRTFAEKK